MLMPQRGCYRGHYQQGVSLSSMSDDIFSIQLSVSDIISGVLLDLYGDDTDGMSEADKQELRNNFAKISDIIIDELGLQITSISDGVAIAELRPANGWS